jgi:hypothetical protein
MKKNRKPTKTLAMIDEALEHFRAGQALLQEIAANDICRNDIAEFLPPFLGWRHVAVIANYLQTVIDNTNLLAVGLMSDRGRAPQEIGTVLLWGDDADDVAAADVEQAVEDDLADVPDAFRDVVRRMLNALDE